MQKSFVILLVMSIMLVQCYTRYQYTPDKYNYDKFDELVSVQFSDSSECIYDDGNFQFKIERDTVLIIKLLKRLNQKYSTIISSDTLMVDQIKSITVLKTDPLLTLIAIFWSITVFLSAVLLIGMEYEGLH